MVGTPISSLKASEHLLDTLTTSSILENKVCLYLILECDKPFLIRLYFSNLRGIIIPQNNNGFLTFDPLIASEELKFSIER